MPNTDSQIVNEIIEAINSLSPKERKILAQSVRTSTDGVSAYKAFNYGVGEPKPAPTQETTA